jgi:type I restriction-modification system DNA methylase subunit
MSGTIQNQLSIRLWTIADKLRGAMNPDVFRYEVLIFLYSCRLFIKGYIHADVDP